jgi:hypothetical protein
MKNTFALIAAFPFALPSARAEVLSFQGRSEIDVVRRGQGYECATAGLESQCKAGQACYVRIQIQGESARALYEAMQLHGTKVDDFSREKYLGTQADAMTCWKANGEFGCAIGYDALSNRLSAIGISKIGMSGFGECE